MTDLEKKVAELRAKYESSLRKYVEGRVALNAAIMNCLDSDFGKIGRLCDLSVRLYPFEAAVAACCAVSKMNYLDAHDDKTDVWKESFIRWVNEWKTEMEKIEI